MKINLNKVAVKVAKLEKGKVEISIAQIKEVMKCFLICLAKEDPIAVLQLLRRY